MRIHDVYMPWIGDVVRRFAQQYLSILIISGEDYRLSHPVRVRGLKWGYAVNGVADFSVAPRAGARIEIPMIGVTII